MKNWPRSQLQNNSFCKKNSFLNQHITKNSYLCNELTKKVQCLK